jgi:hypothetical protein
MIMNLRMAIFFIICAVTLAFATFFFRNPVSSAESLAWIDEAPVQPTGEKTPVIIELFTSEGCSSCPPADVLLMQLEEKQPIAGAQIIALSEHVDYWNRLGWADPYSSALFSQRQSEYSQAFGLRDIYTPQMVVDGKAEFVGSNAQRAREVITEALNTPKAKLSIALAFKAQAKEIPVTVSVESLPEIRKGDTAEILLAIAESNLNSNVLRGENSGRKLEHTAVVRKLQNIGNIDSGKQNFTATQNLFFDKGWNLDNLKVVAFVQERASRRILGAASVKLN